MIGAAIKSKLQELNTSLSLGLTDAKGNLKLHAGYQQMANKQYPAICYDYENYEPDLGMDGQAGTATFDLKLLCVGKSYDSADALAQPIANALDATSGVWGTMTVQGCFLSEIATEHFIDTDLETILYFVTEITMKVCIQL